MTHPFEAILNEIEAGLEGVTPGPWVSLRSDPAEGVNCHWIKAQPSPALRGFSKEIGIVNGTYYADGPDVFDAAHIARCHPLNIRELCRLARLGIKYEAHQQAMVPPAELQRRRGETDNGWPG